MIASSLLMASFGFMVHSVSPAMADRNNQKFNLNSNYKVVPTNADGTINVKLSEEQIKKLNINSYTSNNNLSGYTEGEWVYFISNGYFYKIKKGFFAGVFNDCDNSYEPNTFNYSPYSSSPSNKSAFYKKIK
jgi:hypothetical protein